MRTLCYTPTTCEALCQACAHLSPTVHPRKQERAAPVGQERTCLSSEVTLWGVPPPQSTADVRTNVSVRAKQASIPVPLPAPTRCNPTCCGVGSRPLAKLLERQSHRPVVHNPQSNSKNGQSLPPRFPPLLEARPREAKRTEAWAGRWIYKDTQILCSPALYIALMKGKELTF